MGKGRAWPPGAFSSPGQQSGPTPAPEARPGPQRSLASSTRPASPNDWATRARRGATQCDAIVEGSIDRCWVGRQVCVVCSLLMRTPRPIYVSVAGLRYENIQHGGCLNSQLKQPCAGEAVTPDVHVELGSGWVRGEGTGSRAVAWHHLQAAQHAPDGRREGGSTGWWQGSTAGEGKQDATPGLSL